MHINSSRTYLPEPPVRVPDFDHLVPPSSQTGSPSPIGLSERNAVQPSTVEDPLRKAFHDFVGQTFFAELIKSCRSTQEPSAYFHGGRAEKIFQGQLDQVLTESLSQKTAHTIADPMFDLFMAKRQ